MKSYITNTSKYDPPTIPTKFIIKTFGNNIIEFTLNLPNQKMIVQAYRTTKIYEIKAFIESKFKFSSQFQRLYYDNFELPNDSAIQDHYIIDKTSIDIQLSVPYEKKIPMAFVFGELSLDSYLPKNFDQMCQFIRFYFNNLPKKLLFCYTDNEGLHYLIGDKDFNDYRARYNKTDKTLEIVTDEIILNADNVNEELCLKSEEYRKMINKREASYEVHSAMLLCKDEIIDRFSRQVEEEKKKIEIYCDKVLEEAKHELEEYKLANFQTLEIQQTILENYFLFFDDMVTTGLHFTKIKEKQISMEDLKLSIEMVTERQKEIQRISEDQNKLLEYENLEEKHWKELNAFLSEIPKFSSLTIDPSQPKKSFCKEFFLGPRLTVIPSKAVLDPKSYSNSKAPVVSKSLKDSEKVKVCLDHMKNGCNNKSCQFEHPDRSKIPCRFQMRCTKQICPFKH